MGFNSWAANRERTAGIPNNPLATASSGSAFTFDAMLPSSVFGDGGTRDLTDVDIDGVGTSTVMLSGPAAVRSLADGGSASRRAKREFSRTFKRRTARPVARTGVLGDGPAEVPGGPPMSPPL
jgi:hypothetical protein